MYTFRYGKPSERIQIAKVIVDFSYEYLRGFGKSKEELAQTFSPSVNPSHFMVAVEEENNEIIGTLGITNEDGCPMKVVDKGVFRKDFGMILGSIIVYLFQDESQQSQGMKKAQAYLSFLGVVESAKNKGVAETMINRLLDSNIYSLYTVEIIEGEEHLISFYEKLGFQVVGRKSEKNAWMKHFNFRYRMELQR